MRKQIRIAIATSLLAGTLCACNSHEHKKEAGVKQTYWDVTYQESAAGGVRVCQVSFYGVLPDSKTVDTVLINTIKSAAAIDEARKDPHDILGFGYFGDDSLTKPTQWSGPFIYRSASKQVMLFDATATKTDTPIPN